MMQSRLTGFSAELYLLLCLSPPCLSSFRPSVTSLAPTPTSALTRRDGSTLSGTRTLAALTASPPAATSPKEQLLTLLQQHSSGFDTAQYRPSARGCGFLDYIAELVLASCSCRRQSVKGLLPPLLYVVGYPMLLCVQQSGGLLAAVALWDLGGCGNGGQLSGAVGTTACWCFH